MESSIKRTAQAIDHLPNLPSIPLAFLPIKASAPPAIAPDKPALLPGCKRTKAIKAKDTKQSKMVNAVCTLTPPLCYTFQYNIAKLVSKEGISYFLL